MHGTAAMCFRVAVPGAVGTAWTTTPIGGANLTMTARPGPDLMAITGSAGQLPSHRHRRAWETGGCPSPHNQPPGSSREGKPDKLAWEPLNPRGGSGERIDQTVCAGDGQRRY